VTTAEFLSQLRSRDIRVWVEGDRLRCNAPQGGLTLALREELGLRKPEIVAFLQAAEEWSKSSAVVPMQAAGSRPRLVAVPGHNGDVFCYVRLASHLGTDQPFYALRPPGLDGTRLPLERIEDLAAYFVAEMRGPQPEGPYALGGYCLGGVVAFEMAQQLRAQAHEVALLALFATPSPTALGWRHRSRVEVRLALERLRRHGRILMALGRGERAGYVRTKVRDLVARRSIERGSAERVYRLRVEQATAAAARRYLPRVYPGRITLFLPSTDEASLADDQSLEWEAFAGSGLEVHPASPGCRADIMLQEPYAAVTGARLRQCLDRALAPTCSVRQR
jgi:thioesterase domain-containing protein